LRLFPQLISEAQDPYSAGKVRVLPPEVAPCIAAGEVIERPASAVKELVENALDAGATRVEVGIKGGGVALVRVRDDGSGMSHDDAERAVGRRATSKLSTAEDLAGVDSLGFRGEALHALSSVSSLALTTREAGTEHATRVRVLAGSVPEPSPASHPVGTTVEVRDLFINLPVRRGFLGIVRAETCAKEDNGATLPRHARKGRRTRIRRTRGRGLRCSPSLHRRLRPNPPSTTSYRVPVLGV
jgi:DNA mismatch repair protein MutL